jgi:hypothetical protein
MCMLFPQLWRKRLYSLLPKETQPYHEYLNSHALAKTKRANLEDRYLNSEINLQVIAAHTQQWQRTVLTIMLTSGI